MSIIDNKKAFHEYFVEDRYEAGLVLEGWEAKAIRDGRANIKEAYVLVRGAEVFLFGAHITPLLSASTHITPDPVRTRKLLLHKREIGRLIGAIERQGLTLVPLELYFKRGIAKVVLALGKGKKLHDKRESERERDADREMARAVRTR